MKQHHIHNMIWRRKSKERINIRQVLNHSHMFMPHATKKDIIGIICSAKMFVVGSRRNRKIKVLQLRQSFKKVSEELGV